MKRSHLEHIIRAASAITNQYEIVIVGSQSILGAVPYPPDSLTESFEADVFPLFYTPEDSDKIDGAIGEGSDFHNQFGYYAQGVGPETSTLPRGWQARLVSIQNANTDMKTGYCLDPHDLAVAKLAAWREKDIDFLRELVKHALVRTDEIARLITRVDRFDQDILQSHLDSIVNQVKKSNRDANNDDLSATKEMIAKYKDDHRNKTYNRLANEKDGSNLLCILDITGSILPNDIKKYYSLLSNLKVKPIIIPMIDDEKFYADFDPPSIDFDSFECFKDSIYSATKNHVYGGCQSSKAIEGAIKWCQNKQLNIEEVYLFGDLNDMPPNKKDLPEKTPTFTFWSTITLDEIGSHVKRWEALGEVYCIDEFISEYEQQVLEKTFTIDGEQIDQGMNF